MPRLTFGVQKLVNQWINLNKDNSHHINGLSLESGTLKVLNSSNHGKYERKQTSKFSRDDRTIRTAETVSTLDDETITSARSNSTYISNSSSVDRHSNEKKETNNTEETRLNSVSYNRHEDTGPPNISLHELVCENMLKQGTFGTDYNGKWDEKSVIIKFVTSAISPQEWNKEMLQLWRATNLDVGMDKGCSNVVKLWGWLDLMSSRYCGNHTYSLVTESFDGVDLSRVLRDSLPPFKHYLRVMEQVGSGMTFLHSKGILHGNLRPKNVLLVGNVSRGEFSVKLFDYGFANILKKNVLDDSENIHNVAPELIKNGEVTVATDAYAFGVIVWQLLFCDESNQFSSKFESARSSFLYDNAFSLEKVIEIIDCCCDNDAIIRPEFPQIMKLIQLMKATESLITDYDSCTSTDFNDEDVESKLGRTHEKMASLSVGDDNSYQTKTPSGVSKKNRILRRRTKLDNSNADVGMKNSVCVDASPGLKRVLVLKRRKDALRRSRMKDLMKAHSVGDCKSCCIQLPDDTDMSVGSDEMSDSGSEQGAPPHKKRGFFKMSYAPDPRKDVAIPQGVAIKEVNVPNDTTLIEPILPSRGEMISYEKKVQMATDVPWSNLTGGNNNVMICYNHEYNVSPLKVKLHNDLELNSDGNEKNDKRDSHNVELGVSQSVESNLSRRNHCSSETKSVSATRPKTNGTEVSTSASANSSTESLERSRTMPTTSMCQASPVRSSSMDVSTSNQVKEESSRTLLPSEKSAHLDAVKVLTSQFASS